MILNFLLRIFTPIQKIMQKLGRSEPKMNRDSVDLAMSLIQVGDIIVTHENQRLTSLFIKGEYDHAAIVSPSGVVEAVGDDFDPKWGLNVGGVRKVDLEEFLFLMDKVAIIRPIIGKEENYIAGCNALSYIGKGYDYEFKIDKDKIYCSELVYLSYKEFGIFDFGKKQILPQQFRDLCDDVNFKLIFEFK